MRPPSLRLAALALLFSGLLFSLAPLASAQKPAPKSQPESQDRLADLEQRIEFLETRISYLAGQMISTLAFLDCNTKKYVEFGFDDSHLVYFASCENIEPYLEGHRVLLKIGNPSSFNFSKLKGTLHYGKSFGDGIKQKVEVSTAETLRGGAWLLITVTINPSKPEDLRKIWLELGAETTGPTR